jgi:hypothetical protein
VKLVTYARRGRRRLGVLLGERVVDLADLVGHPVFPTTMEALIARSGGTVLEAARAVMARGGWRESVVPRARQLVPALPTRLRLLEDDPPAGGGGLVSVSGSARARRHWTGLVDLDPDAVLGPGEDLPWPLGARTVSVRPGISLIVGRAARDLTAKGAGRALFGYTAACVWRWGTRRGTGRRTAPAGRAGLTVSLGPSVATVEELEHRVLVVVRVDGEVRSRGPIPDLGRTARAALALASRGADVHPGDMVVITVPTGGPADHGRLRSGCTVEIEVEGIGTLRNRIGAARRVAGSRARSAP